MTIKQKQVYNITHRLGKLLCCLANTIFLLLFMKTNMLIFLLLTNVTYFFGTNTVCYFIERFKHIKHEHNKI